MDGYCEKDRRVTPSVEGTEKIVLTKNNRKMLKAKCAVCGITNTRFFVGKLTVPSRAEGSGILSSVADTGLELFISKDILFLAKKWRRGWQILCFWGNEKSCVAKESNKLWHEKKLGLRLKKLGVSCLTSFHQKWGQTTDTRLIELNLMAWILKFIRRVESSLPVEPCLGTIIPAHTIILNNNWNIIQKQEKSVKYINSPPALLTL